MVATACPDACPAVPLVVCDRSGRGLLSIGPCLVPGSGRGVLFSQRNQLAMSRLWFVAGFFAAVAGRHRRGPSHACPGVAVVVYGSLVCCRCLFNRGVASGFLESGCGT